MANFEGCTIGRWRNNLQIWVPTAYETTDSFDDIFDREVTDSLTLLQALNYIAPPPPEGIPNTSNLVRQAVAALLNASHPEVNYPLTVQQVIMEFQVAWDSQTQAIIKTQGERFDEFNNLGCPI